jgi:hypothetical protein
MQWQGTAQPSSQNVVACRLSSVFTAVPSVRPVRGAEFRSLSNEVKRTVLCVIRDTGLAHVRAYERSYGGDTALNSLIDRQKLRAPLHAG